MVARDPETFNAVSVGDLWRVVTHANFAHSQK
jgi:hypothetical protein